VTAEISAVGAAGPRHDERGHRHQANQALGFSALGLAIAGGIELAIAVLTGSVALLGDALHNLSDVSTSLVVFLGFRVSKRLPTARYPYGFERAEDLAGLGVALVIWASAIFAGYESLQKLISGAPTSHLTAGVADWIRLPTWILYRATTWLPITPTAAAATPAVRWLVGPPLISFWRLS
jgi:divalent metal cation (Fe/Co/Zn/Cd) transporter